MANPISSLLESIGLKAAQPENTVPGPGDVGPTITTKSQSGLVTLDMPEEECMAWWRRYDLGKQRITARQSEWDTLLKAYLPIVSESGAAETVKVQAHFRNVHTKIGQLFYRTPELVLTPQEPSPADNQIPNPAPVIPGQPPPPPLKMEDLIFIKQSILNKIMGRDGIKVGRLMDELLFDVLAWSGIGCSKLGYSCAFRDIPPAPTQPGSILGLQAPPEQVPIYEEKYWRRFSPKKVVFNHDLRSTRYDEDATFIGMDFYMSPKQAMKQFQLSEEDANKAASDSMIFQYDADKSSDGSQQGLVHGIEIWCKASYFTDEAHPQAIHQLVLIEGIKDRPIVWRPSPDQEFDPTTGQLTKDSMVGFPIRILTIRDLADSPFPQSDAAFTNSEIKQLSTWRRQSIQLRDAQLGKYLYDPDAMDDEVVDQLKNGEVGQFIPVTGGKLRDGAETVISPVTKIQGTNDDYRGFEGIKSDMNETLGISATQSGVETSTVHSATEVKQFSAASSGRSDKELARVVDFFLDGVRMIDQLIMRYTTTAEYIQLEGEAAAATLQVWNGKMVTGKFYYDIAPDSQMRADSAQEFQLDLNYYNITAKDALSNRAYVLRKLARRRGLDPNKAVLDPSKIAQPKPVPPTISFALKGEDLADPSVMEILMNAELLKPPPQAPPGALPPHGEPVNKHEMGKSGGMGNAPGAPNHRENQP